MQDMFAFLVDEKGTVEIGDDKFKPGFFVWNSETGARSVGIQTFWHQHICGNHIVYDCVNVNEFSRKHTSNVKDALGEIRDMIESLVSAKGERQERFECMIKRAKKHKLGRNYEEVATRLRKLGIPSGMLKIAKGVVGIDHSAFSWVDALTRASGRIEFAGKRAMFDQKIGTILSLAS